MLRLAQKRFEERGEVDVLAALELAREVLAHRRPGGRDIWAEEADLAAEERARQLGREPERAVEVAVLARRRAAPGTCPEGRQSGKCDALPPTARCP